MKNNMNLLVAFGSKIFIIEPLYRHITKLFGRPNAWIITIYVCDQISISYNCDCYIMYYQSELYRKILFSLVKSENNLYTDVHQPYIYYLIVLEL
jgi:hypothetical protein